jgi:ATP-dependent protease ClpP protease subunit
VTVTIVVGPPCAGKSTYIDDQHAPDDVVVDFDRLAQALGSSTEHDPTDDVARATHAARYSAIAQALEVDTDSWIVETSPTPDRVATYEAAGAEFVLLDPGEQVCLDRAVEDDRPEGTADVIRAWYEDPPALPENTRRVDDVSDRVARGREGVTMTDRNPYGVPQARQRDWYRISDVVRDEARGTSSADIWVDDEIDPWWGISAATFRQELNALDVDHINLYVNSPGGSVYEAIDMMNNLSRHKAHVTATVNGLAASAASFLILGADEVVMAPHSELMIHDASTIVWGNAADMERGVADLNRISDNIAGMYADKAGGEAADWRVLMRAETWYTDREAVAAGLADRVEGTARDDVEDHFDLSRFAHAGRSQAPAPETTDAVASLRERLIRANVSPADAVLQVAARLVDRAPKPPTPSEDSTTTHNQKGSDPMDATIRQGFIDALGITDAAVTDEAILAATREALAESVEDTSTARPTAALPGTTVIDSTVLASLQKDAAAGREARDEQNKTRRAAILDKAIDEGRMAPSNRKTFAALLEADEAGTVEQINALAPVFNTEGKGYQGGVAEAGDEGPLTYDMVYGSPKTKSTTEQKGA